MKDKYYPAVFMQNGLCNKIESLQNTKIKQIVRLRNRRERDLESKYLIEGYRELLRAEKGFSDIESLYICREFFLGESEEILIKEIVKKGGQIFECTKDVFGKISYRDRPDGLLAVARKSPMLLEDLKFSSKNPLLLIAVEIEKPGNLGTILRSADAAGADAVIIVDKVTDIYNPNVVRASVGTLFTQPVIETSSEKLCPWLKENNFKIIATSPDAETNYIDSDYTSPCALLVGSEQYGLSKDWFEKADEVVSIPMRGVADSLNVATSTTLLLYEALRQRKI